MIKETKKKVEDIVETPTIITETVVEKKPEAIVEASVSTPVFKEVKKSVKNEEYASADSQLIQTRILEDVNAVIGKRRYKLAKGAVTKLPANVYEVLKKAKKAI